MCTLLFVTHHNFSLLLLRVQLPMPIEWMHFAQKAFVWWCVWRTATTIKNYSIPSKPCRRKTKMACNMFIYILQFYRLKAGKTHILKKTTFFLLAICTEANAEKSKHFSRNAISLHGHDRVECNANAIFTIRKCKQHRILWSYSNIPHYNIELLLKNEIIYLLLQKKWKKCVMKLWIFSLCLSRPFSLFHHSPVPVHVKWKIAQNFRKHTNADGI